MPLQFLRALNNKELPVILIKEKPISTSIVLIVSY